MKLNPYLHFDGRCDEALGAQVKAVMRFKENPQPEFNPPGMDDKIMHADVQIGETHVMMSDGRCVGDAKFEGISLTLSVADAAEADRVFNALLAGGEVQMPIGETFFSPRFGMVKDKFGVVWMVIVPRGM